MPGKVIQGRFGQWRPLAAAAALAACLVAAVGLYRTGEVGPQQPPTYREAEHAGIRSLLPAGQALPRQAAVLRWSPVSGAVSYDVQVSTDDLQPVATAKGQTAAEYRLAGERPARPCHPAPGSSGRWTPSAPTAPARPRRRSPLRCSKPSYHPEVEGDRRSPLQPPVQDARRAQVVGATCGRPRRRRYLRGW